jgi:hypothetical protein
MTLGFTAQLADDRRQARLAEAERHALLVGRQPRRPGLHLTLGPAARWVAAALAGVRRWRRSTKRAARPVAHT